MRRTCRIVDIKLTESRTIAVITKPIDQASPADLKYYREILYLRRQEYRLLEGTELNLDETDTPTPLEELQRAAENLEKGFRRVSQLGRKFAGGLRAAVGRFTKRRKKS